MPFWKWVSYKEEVTYYTVANNQKVLWVRENDEALRGQRLLLILLVSLPFLSSPLEISAASLAFQLFQRKMADSWDHWNVKQVSIRDESRLYLYKRMEISKQNKQIMVIGFNPFLHWSDTQLFPFFYYFK